MHKHKATAPKREVMITMNQRYLTALAASAALAVAILAGPSVAHNPVAVNTRLLGYTSGNTGTTGTTGPGTTGTTGTTTGTTGPGTTGPGTTGTTGTTGPGTTGPGTTGTTGTGTTQTTNSSNQAAEETFLNNLIGGTVAALLWEISVPIAVVAGAAAGLFSDLVIAPSLSGPNPPFPDDLTQYLNPGIN